MAGNLELIKKLREASGAGISACQKALKECGDDYDKAFDFLRKQGISKASSKADRPCRNSAFTASRWLM